MKRLLVPFVLAVTLLGCAPSEPAAKAEPRGDDKVKIGLIVKSMADSWFQNETKFAKEKADALGVELTVQEALNGDAVLSTIDTMATNGVQGLIICSPETQLGPAIVAATNRHKMKLMSVDDRLVGADGKPLAEVPHLGISAKEIGRQVGQALQDEMKRRGWNAAEVAALAIVVPTLETAKERAAGAEQVLTEGGFPKAQIFTAPWTGALDVAAASDAANAVLTAQSKYKKWLVFSSNDDGVLGGLRAIRNRGIPIEDAIGVGINGALAAAEWKKKMPTSLVGSILLQPRIHGGQTVEAMTKWIREGTAPAPETFTTGSLITPENYVEALRAEGL
jgi:ABC-type sugar transport system substrate-binding protein